MIKFTMLCGALAVAFLAGGRTVYSGLQVQIPFGTAFKMTPDPSNIWSFHETVTVTHGQTVDVPVLVDFDNNQRMDTEASNARVLVTDAQVSPGASDLTVLLLDDQGMRWDLSPVPGGAGGSLANTVYRPANIHFSTPISLPTGSGLKVQVKNTHFQDSRTVRINLIGRLVTM